MKKGRLTRDGKLMTEGRTRTEVAMMREDMRKGGLTKDSRLMTEGRTRTDGWMTR